MNETKSTVKLKFEIQVLFRVELGSNTAAHAPLEMAKWTTTEVSICTGSIQTQYVLSTGCMPHGTHEYASMRQQDQYVLPLYLKKLTKKKIWSFLVL